MRARTQRVLHQQTNQRQDGMSPMIAIDAHCLLTLPLEVQSAKVALRQSTSMLLCTIVGPSPFESLFTKYSCFAIRVSRDRSSAPDPDQESTVRL